MLISGDYDIRVLDPPSRDDDSDWWSLHKTRIAKGLLLLNEVLHGSENYDNVFLKLDKEGLIKLHPYNSNEENSDLTVPVLVLTYPGQEQEFICDHPLNWYYFSFIELYGPVLLDYCETESLTGLNEAAKEVDSDSLFAMLFLYWYDTYTIPQTFDIDEWPLIDVRAFWVSFDRYLQQLEEEHRPFVDKIIVLSARIVNTFRDALDRLPRLPEDSGKISPPYPRGSRKNDELNLRVYRAVEELLDGGEPTLERIYKKLASESHERFGTHLTWTQIKGRYSRYMTNRAK